MSIFKRTPMNSLDEPTALTYMADRRGIIFDIKEFAVHDGPGIRTTVFSKGCPLRCAWCHNPESLQYKPQLLRYPQACRECGSCKHLCPAVSGAPSYHCTGCGRCAAVCPGEARRLCGRQVCAGELAGQLAQHNDVYKQSGGGVTISGGEPLAQPEFLFALMTELRRYQVHITLDTSGCGAPPLFRRIIDLTLADLVLFDLKLADETEHRRWTGIGNGNILTNLTVLAGGTTPFWIRIPLVPGVTDTPANIAGLATIISELKRQPERIELLPYHKSAGAKYAACGYSYKPGFDIEALPDPRLGIWRAAGLEVYIS